jgi:peptidyl-prolyl cis-trans isomerase-like 1
MYSILVFLCVQWLDGKHTIFGRIHAGMMAVKNIGHVETDSNDRPVDDVKIIRGHIRMQ